ncbi:tyrosine-type recombinase/integrase [Staphylococcus simulans]|uniref:Transposase from transposon Tn916 n=1 Tax=Staphylococcus simulans TaxID=1286 RepID=A0A6N3ARQ4_STASI
MRMRQYEKGKWQYEFKYNNKRYRKKGFRTKKEAEYAGIEKLNELQQGYSPDNTLTLHQYLTQWVITYKRNSVSKSTYGGYKSNLKILKSFKIADIPIAKLTRLDVQNFLTAYTETRSQVTGRKMRSLLKTSLDDAVYDGLIKRNPVYRITFKAGHEPKKETDKFISIEEYKRLKNKLMQSNKRMDLILFIMICTGCRVSGAINMKSSYIGKDLYIDEQKTDSSPRYVDVAKEDMQHIRKVISTWAVSMDGYIFKDRGILPRVKRVNARLGELCEELDIKKITTHALRHTHCSYLLSQGVSIQYISKRLGHKNMRITLEVYSHLLEEQFDEENNQAIEVLGTL